MTAPIIFVTGTDTDVGKTFTSALLVSKWQCDYWKPAQTGLESDTGDTKTVHDFCSSGRHMPHLFPPRYALQKPLCPLEAMDFEPHHDIQLSDFQLPEERINTPLVIEGAGGIYVPITRGLHVTTDLIKHFITSTSRPVRIIVVARSGLGTLNHTLLTMEHLKNAGLLSHTLGCIVNGQKNPGNVAILERYGVSILAQVDHCSTKEDITLALGQIPELADLSL
ncbi:LADA_0A00254g1_1 [Lachancea dasiensis]|uniref:LADA_0A00254g1_1 n=1 Tax=Lachancea dasiensis TaxID=1072105 RepID=A0A1G4ILK0_9SACH|nr:LADA_0A00254g1_1 [Lachancea dasiensis]